MSELMLMNDPFCILMFVVKGLRHLIESFRNFSSETHCILPNAWTWALSTNPTPTGLRSESDPLPGPRVMAGSGNATVVVNLVTGWLAVVSNSWRQRSVATFEPALPLQLLHHPSPAGLLGHYRPDTGHVTARPAAQLRPEHHSSCLWSALFPAVSILQNSTEPLEHTGMLKSSGRK